MNPLAATDRWLFDGVAAWQAPWLDELLLPATHVGGHAFVWVVLALILFVFPARRAGAWRLLLAVALTATMVDVVIKPIVDRARPFTAMPGVRVIDTRPTTASFPSGHAANAAAGAMAAARVLPGARLVWWTLAVVIAVSRVYVGVHYPFDVLGGAILGLACAWLVLGGSPATRAAPPVTTHDRADE